MAASAASRSRCSRADVVVVGGGVVGCALLYELSVVRGYGSRVTLVEKREHLITGASAGNSGIDHSGFDATPSTIESECLQVARDRKQEVYGQLGVPHRRVGAVMVAWTDHDMSKLSDLVCRASSVRMKRVDRGELFELEPHLSRSALGGLVIYDEGVVDPWLLPILMVDAAQRHGAQVYVNSEVTSCTRVAAAAGRWRVECGNGHSITCDQVVNCAGLYGDHVHDMITRGRGRPQPTDTDSFHIQPRRGQFVVYGKDARHLINHIILPVPKPQYKGIIVFPTVYDNVVVGPTAEDVESRDDESVSDDVSRDLMSRGCSIIPSLAQHGLISSYTGIRPASRHHTDYVIRHDNTRSG